MGLFSGSHRTHRGYDIVPLKDNVELQDDLWKNSKLRMNKAFMDGGVEAYSKLSYNMYKKIRKKYSTSYLQNAGVVTNNTFKMIEFNRDTLQNYLIVASEDPTTILIDYQVNETITIDNNLQYLLGGFTKVKCSLTASEDDNTYYDFVVTGGNTIATPTSQTSTTRTMIIIDRLEDGSYISKEVPLAIQYEKLEPIDVTGVMYPTNTFNYIKNNQKDLWGWLRTPKQLANTIDYGSLRVSYDVVTENISEITITDTLTGITTSSGLARNTPTNFTVTATLEGKAKGLENQVTTVTEEIDSNTIPEDTIISNTETSIEGSYYDTAEAINETNSTDIGELSSTYTVIGDRKIHVTTVIEDTYLPSTRKDESDNVIKTYIRTTTTTIITEYEPINYTMVIGIVQPVISCYPKISYSIKPVMTTDVYSGYMVLNTNKISIREFINNHTIVVSHKDYYGDRIIDKTISLTSTPKDINKVEQILIQADAIRHGYNRWPITNVVGPLVSYHESHHFKRNVGLFFNKTPQEALNLDVITLTGNNLTGDYIKVAVEVSSDMYSISEDYLLTPVVLLRYADSILYSKSKADKAKQYTVNSLKRIITLMNQYSSYLDPNSGVIINEYPREDKKTDIDTIQNIIETIEGSIGSIHSTIDNNKIILKEITEAISEKNPPNIDSMLTKLSDSDNFESADNKTKKLQNILATMGIPKEGLDDLIDTVSTNNDIYTAAIMSGLRIFNEDNILIEDPTNVRAKVLHLFADIMTIKSIILNTPMTFSISNYTINATYTYTIEKSIIQDFKTTNEYSLATAGSKLNKKYFMRTSYEVVKTIDDGYHIWNLKNQIIYTYKINRDGSATRFKFISIDMNLTSHDGKYKISTCDSYSLDPWSDTIRVTPRINLHKLIIVYPENINMKLSFHEYSNLYNDNLFLFVYSRKRTHTKWYQSGFFGFVLIVAVITAIAVTGQWEAAPGAIALAPTEATILTAVEVGVFSYGLSITFPNMPMAMRIAVTIAMTYAAGGVNSGSISSTATPAATTPITISSITSSIENYFTNMSTLELTTFTADKLTTAYTAYIKDKLENYTDEAKKFIEIATEATEKLDDKLKEFDVQDERTKIFASFMMDFIEAETYDQIAVSETYMSNDFNIDLLTYLSSTECQADMAKIPNLPVTSIMV